jgi:hypothetical protein
MEIGRNGFFLQEEERGKPGRVRNGFVSSRARIPAAESRA